MSGGEKIIASDEDWGALLDFDLEAQDEDYGDILEPSEELGRVSRRIAAQYAEVIAAFASTAFRDEVDDAMVDQVHSAIDAMTRLAEASSSTTQSTLLEEVAALVAPATTGGLRTRRRQRALIELRDWIPRFAETLEPEDAERLRQVVSWKDGAHPLISQLAGVKGIGPKRLQRLYAAGLYMVDVVATADPEEVAAVTGMPLKLAADVVAFTKDYAVQERRRCIEALRERAILLRRMLKSVPDSSDDILDLADDAIREVESAFQELHARSRAK